MQNDGIRYDRATAARILAEVAGADFLAGPAPAVAEVSVAYRVEELDPEPGGSLTTGQRRYLESFMRPCRPDQVVSATHRITWRDSRGIANSGHIGPGPLGAILPIAAREAVIAVGDAIAEADPVTARSDALDDDALDVLADTTTDQEPAEIFRVGAEAAGRALVQHGMLAGQVGIEDPVEFAEAMWASGLYGTVASTWFWEPAGLHLPQRHDPREPGGERRPAALHRGDRRAARRDEAPHHRRRARRHGPGPRGGPGRTCGDPALPRRARPDLATVRPAAGGGAARLPRAAEPIRSTGSASSH